MRLLLLGGNGQVGRELRRTLPALGELQVATRDGREAAHAADFTQPQAVAALVDALRPDVVVNAAAYTAVDRAEAEPALAFRVNAETPAAVAAACARHGACLLHYSTDYVFDGLASRPYREDDPTAPTGVYGASKLAGEQAIAASGAHHLILRTAWVYAAHGHNFVRTMLRLAGEREELRVVADQVGCPTSAAWIAQATAHVLQARPADSGTWHLACAGQTSWHGFASAIVAEAHALGLLARAPRVVAITSADYPTPASRPPWSVLDTGRLQRRFGLVPPDWRAALQPVLRALAAA